MATRKGARRSVFKRNLGGMKPKIDKSKISLGKITSLSSVIRKMSTSARNKYRQQLVSEIASIDKELKNARRGSAQASALNQVRMTIHGIIKDIDSV